MKGSQPSMAETQHAQREQAMRAAMVVLGNPNRIPPALYRLLNETTIGTHEQGYVHTPSGGTLMGMESKYFDDYLPEVPPALIQRLSPTARALLHDAPAFFQHVGRMLEPLGGGDQPASGTPRQSRAYADRPGPHAHDIAVTREIILGMLYREYVQKPGIEYVTPALLPQMVDMFIHVGGQRAWANIGKAMADADAITATRFNGHYPYMTSSELASDANFALSAHGGDYGRRATQRKIIHDLEAIPPHLLDRFRTQLVKWRKISRDCENAGAHHYCEGENKRADSFLPDSKIDVTQPQMREAKVQVIRPWFSNPIIAVQTAQGLISYEIDGAGNFLSAVQVPSTITALKNGDSVSYKAPYSRAVTHYTNPYRDGTVVFAAAKSDYMGPASLPEIFFASPEFNRAALTANRNLTLGVVANNDFTLEQDGSLADSHSFYVVYGGPNDAMYISPRSPEQAAKASTALTTIQPPAIETASPPPAENLYRPVSLPELPARSQQR